MSCSKGEGVLVLEHEASLDSVHGGISGVAHCGHRSGQGDPRGKRRRGSAGGGGEDEERPARVGGGRGAREEARNGVDEEAGGERHCCGGGLGQRESAIAE